MIINGRLISHPMNWVIIILMVLIAAYFGHLVLFLLDQSPSTATSAAGLPQGYSNRQAG
jgi:hypothetical protein